MSGRGKGRGKGRSQGRGGRGGGSGRGRATNTSNTSSTKCVGLTPSIKNYTIDYGIKNCADHNRQSWEKIVTYLTGLLGPDIGTELTTGVEITIPKPEHTTEQKKAHEEAEQKRVVQVQRLLTALQAK